MTVLNRVPFATCGLMLAFVCGPLITTACNEPPGVNPWRDDSIPRAEWTNPSEQGVIEANKEPVIRERESETIETSAYGGVPHYPLWWEDPFEDKGDGDGKFAWTYADYIALPYGQGRFLLNTMAFPVSVVVTPPWTSMVSDGEIGRDHDAQPGFTPDPTGEPGDLIRPESVEPIEAKGADPEPVALVPPADGAADAEKNRAETNETYSTPVENTP